MKTLLLGGTAWLGGYIAREALARGHDLTCVARGESGAVPAGAGFVSADRDADDALSALAGEHWDAVIDVSRQPGQVRRTARDLRDSAGHYVFVSSVSAYADHAALGQNEDAPLLDPLEGDVMESMGAYGQAKVACEQAVIDGFGAARSLIVRAGLIAGPGDVSGRSGYWPLRFAQASVDRGAILVPDAADLPAQLIDVRDLAAWLVAGAEQRVAGTFNATGDTGRFGDLIAEARRIAGHQGPVVLARGSWLLAQGVNEWAGPRSLPLWLDDPEWRGFSARSNGRAKAAGLTLRDPAETLADTLAWEREQGADRAGRMAGLTAAEEAELLRALSSPDS